MTRLKGLNLGCFLEYKETYKQDINLEKIIEHLKAENYNAIRLLISSFLLKEEDYMEVLNNTIKTITENKMYCVVTLGGHELYSSDSWISFKDMIPSEKKTIETIHIFMLLWRNIIKKLPASEYLIFESFSELHDGHWGKGFNLMDGGRSYDIINKLNFAFFNAIHYYNVNTLFIFKPYCQLPNMLSFLDKKLLKIKNGFVGAAYYGINDKFSISAEEKILDEKMAKNNIKLTLKKVSKFKNFIFTEVGCNTEDSLKPEMRKLFLLYKKMIFKKYSYFLWDDGKDFILIDRKTGELQYDFLLEDKK